MGFMQPDISDDFFQTFQITSNFLNQTHFFTKDGLPVPWPALAAFSTKRPGMNIDEMKGSMGAGPWSGFGKGWSFLPLVDLYK